MTKSVIVRIAIASAMCFAAIAGAQATMAPVNDKPNPYQTIEGWAKMPDGRTWGSTSAVDIDKDGMSIWVAERCGTNSCVGSPLDPVLKFDANDNNVGVTDCSCTDGRRGVT